MSLKSLIRISFNPLGSVDATLSVEIDVRKSVSNLKELISKIINKPLNEFKIRRAFGVKCLLIYLFIYFLKLLIIDHNDFFC